MDDETALSVLAALAHPTRLAAYRLLVRHAPEGLTTGDLVRGLGLSQSTVSTHLAVLARAGLVHTARRGRNQIQRAALGRVPELMRFLERDCCLAHAEPVVAPRDCPGAADSARPGLPTCLDTRKDLV